MQSKTDRSSKLWCAGLGCSLLLLATVLANAQTTSTIKCVQVASATLLVTHIARGRFLSSGTDCRELEHHRRGME